MKQLDFNNVDNKFKRIEELPKQYFDDMRKVVKEDDWYPKFHIAPKYGLLNDPNGLCQIDGTYHLFYQWFPLGTVHGLKHWYHITTKDFINYEDFGIGIIPDSDFDYCGCYTGMILGKNIYYTGIGKNDKEPSACMATLENGNVVNKKCLFKFDPDITTRHFRDPYVWEKNGIYYMINGGQSKEEKGIITIHKSNNGIDFSYLGNLKLNLKNTGYMLECPNYYEKDEKGIIMFSPQGIDSPNKYDYRNVFSVSYSVGNFINYENLEFKSNNFYELDKGFDFYAPQIFQDEKERTILIGWLGNSKTPYPSDKNNWAHMLTIPRILTVKNDFLVQQPIDELKSLRKEKIQFDNKIKLRQNYFEVVLEGNEQFEFFISNEKGENISFKATEEEYILDRKDMTYLYNEIYGLQRYSKRRTKYSKTIIYVDCSSIEIFCDNGEVVFTGRFFIDSFNQISINGTKGELYYLNKINLNYLD